MSTSTHLIFVPSDFNVEDAFSSTTTSNYTPASPDYSPTSSGNTFFDPLEDLSKDLWASLAISPFHDDPYMKVMQVYNATSNESLCSTTSSYCSTNCFAFISSVTLLPMFDPRDFFLLEEILPPQKQARFLSSSSTDSSAPPQVFEIRESSYKTSLERHEKQIKTILNHLDELPLERVEQVKEKIEGLGNGRVIIQRDFDSLETELQEARTQIARLQREQIGHDEEIVLARIRISTLEMIIEDIQDYYGSLTIRMALKRTSTSAVPAMAQADIRKLVSDSVATALEAQATNIANADNTNKNTEPREAHVDLALSSVILATREKGHCNYQCSKANNNAHGRTYLLRKKNAYKDPNVVIDTTYDIEMANGNLVGTNTVIQGWTLILLNQPFEIDLMPIKLGSFDVIIGMDWLSKYHARIICDEKVVHIPIDGEILIIRAQVMEKKSDERRLKDIPVVREFQEVFPEDLPGLPPSHQVEFQIDLIPRAAPVARAPYRLAP
nr:putative reverse transcriptase domain-containing protein [Tanacetum cinerariifolium]